MRVVFLAFIAIIGVTQAQRTPKPPPPPPGFGPESGSGSRPKNGVSFSVNRESSKTPSISPFTSKWVFCNGSWQIVSKWMVKEREEDQTTSQLFRLTRSPVLLCSLILTFQSTETFAGTNQLPIVFISLKTYIFSTSGSLFGSYSPSTSGFWHYNTSSGRYSYCAGLPCCMCQACCGGRRW